jgi:hypothetical protein
MKKLLCLIALALFSSGLWLVLPKNDNNGTVPPPTNAIAELHTAEDDDTRNVVIATNFAPANEQVHLHYGDTEPYIGVTGVAGIPIPNTAQMTLQIFTPTNNAYYNFEKITLTENETETEITALPCQIPVGTTDIHLFVQFVPVQFDVTLEICDNEGNTFADEQYTRIQNYISAPAAVAIGSQFIVTVNTEELYSNELYTLASIQIRTFDADGNVITPYPIYTDGLTVDTEFIERYSKNIYNVRLRINLVKKYKLSLVMPTDPNAEWFLTIKDNGNAPVKDPSQNDNYSYIVDSGNKITITTQVVNKYTANDGFAGLPDVQTLTTDTALIKTTEFFIKQNSTIKLLIEPKVFTLAGVTDNPNYKLTKNTIALGDKVGIILQEVPQNYGISNWTVNGRNYKVEGNTVYITADKLWFQVNDKFIDLDTGVIQLESNPTLEFKKDIIMVIGLPAGIAFICLLIMSALVIMNKKRTETIREHLLGTGKTYRLKVKEEKRRIMLEKHQKEVEEFERAKQERLDKIKAKKEEELAKKRAEEENEKMQQKLTADRKQEIYEMEAAEYKMPTKNTEETPAAKETNESKYNMPPSPATAESKTEGEVPKFNMPPAPASALTAETAATETTQYNMPPQQPQPAAAETVSAAETAAAAAPAPTASVSAAPVQAPAVTETAAPTAAVTTPTQPTAPAPIPQAAAAPTPIAPAPVRMPQPPTAPRPAMPRPMGQPMPPRPGMPMPPRPMQPPMPRPMQQQPTPPRPMQPPIPMGQRPQPQPLTGQPRPMGQPLPPLPRPITPMQPQTATPTPPPASVA